MATESVCASQVQACQQIGKTSTILKNNIKEQFKLPPSQVGLTEAINSIHDACNTFNPDIHLNYREPNGVITMEELGLTGPDNEGISRIACTQPFRLFSELAVQKMREEIFQTQVLEKHTFVNNRSACQLRGYAAEYAPFTYQAWNHPKTLEILSKLAEIELVPIMDYEVGHINISLKSSLAERAEFKKVKSKSLQETFKVDAEVAMQQQDTLNNDDAVVAWHRDSYPFVCVLMLSDCSNMRGGETALKMSDGRIIRVSSPQMGWALVLQGRYIVHQAEHALGYHERITSVTSFRARDPFVRDDTVLTTVRAISNLGELYRDFAHYRMDIADKNLRKIIESVCEQKEKRQTFNVQAFKQSLSQYISFLQRTLDEMVDEDLVNRYSVDNRNLPDFQASA